MIGFKDFSLRPHPSLRHRCGLSMIMEGQMKDGGKGTTPRRAFLLLGSISPPAISAFDCSNLLIATKPARPRPLSTVYLAVRVRRT
jgi:hypothetical protein